MKKIIAFIVFPYAIVTFSFAQKKTVTPFELPDSIKAVSFISDLNISDDSPKKEFKAGIQDGGVSVYVEMDKKDFEFIFEYPTTATLLTTGHDVEKEKGEVTWHYKGITTTDTYKLMLSVASDSAENFITYAGYTFLPKENKWKLIGACKITGRWGTIKSPAGFFTTRKKNQPSVKYSNTWCQRSNGSWKAISQANEKPPVINLFPHIDSAAQAIAETDLIDQAIKSGNTDAKQMHEGIYYTILKEGTGRLAKLTDTVTIYYKGYLFSDGTVFDQTKEKPATFPLKRLIRGWQIGVPLCKVGSKIKLVIPSGLAYSIRTRAAKIPPNSILVFEIEVLETKEGS